MQVIEQIEKYAKDNGLPIMLSDGIDYLCNYIKDNNIKSILEIGSAIGYSAIRMALVDNEIQITTIEKDEERYKEALKNISDFDLNSRIDIRLEDAMDCNIEGEFDLIFIDASKGHNIDFFNKYKKNLKENGVIITDNLSFHGLVEDESKIKTKNQRSLVKKIKLFIDFLDNNLEFNTEYINVGDKISISKKVKE